jgi:hypothetical protein
MVPSLIPATDSVSASRQQCLHLTRLERWQYLLTIADGRKSPI